MAYTSRCNYSKTDVVNMALSMLGSERLQVADIAKDTGHIPDVVNQYYSNVMEEIVNTHPWNNLTVHDTITLSATTSFDWKYVGVLPNDCQRLWYVFDGQNTNNFTPESLPYMVVGRMVYTDIFYTESGTKVDLAYTVVPFDADGTPEDAYQQFDPHVLRCFYTLLAARISVGITGNYDLESAIYDEYYNIVLPDAIRTNNIEGHGPFYDNSENEIVKLNSYTTFEKI